MVDFLDRGGVSHLITKMLDTVYPVNSIYISLDSTSPASLYGGTWERFGKGKTLVGVDEADTDFKTAGLTGGEKKHTLTSAEIPIIPGNFVQQSSKDYGLSLVVRGLVSGADNRYMGIGPVVPNGTHGQEHNNIQPYVSVYIWKRVS